MWKLLAVVVPLMGCKSKSPKPYELRGAAPGAPDGTVTAIVDGTAIAAKNDKFLLPAGMQPSAIKTVAFRYQTPCGAYDVPNKIKLDSVNKYDPSVEANPASDAGYLWDHLVIVDSGGSKAEVMVGKQALRAAGDSEQGSSTDGWDKVHVGRIFGTECAADHVVTVDGKPVGKLPGRAPTDLAASDTDKYSLPIFVTTKAVCYRLVLREVEYKNTTSGATQTGHSADQTFMGPGAFYIALRPDVFGKAPDDASKPSGLYEVPCQPPQPSP